MSDAGPHASGDVFNRNVVPCSGDGIRGTQASATSAQQQRVVVLTDMVSPPPSSIAGADLATNLMKFKQSGVTVALHEWCQSVLQWWAPWMKDANHSQGKVLPESGLMDPDFWEDFNTRNVGRSSTRRDVAVKEPENKQRRCC